MANVDAVGFFSSQRLCHKAVYIRHFGGTREFKPPSPPHHPSLLCACCHSCDVIFLFIYHVCLKHTGFLLQVCDSLASGRLHCRMGRQQGAPVLFGEPF